MNSAHNLESWNRILDLDHGFYFSRLISDEMICRANCNMARVCVFNLVKVKCHHIGTKGEQQITCLRIFDIESLFIVLIMNFLANHNF